MGRLLSMAGVVCLAAATAQADPHVRFGFTMGIDRNVPEAHEFGPLIAVGTSAGRFSAEASYAYLSMFDSATRVHRAGVGLRMDLVRRWDLKRQSRAWFVDAGVARRMGEWSVDNIEPAVDKTQDELQLGGGYELSNHGGAWQVGLHFGFARRDPMLGTACRGLGCSVAMPSSTGVAESVLVEWTWLLGRGY